MRNNNPENLHILNFENNKIIYPYPENADFIYLGVNTLKNNRSLTLYRIYTEGEPIKEEPPQEERIGPLKVIIKPNPYNPNTGNLIIDIGLENSDSVNVKIKKEK